MSDLVPIGFTARAHGIRGELVFVPTTEDLALAQGRVFLRPRAGGNAKPFTIRARRAHHGNLLLSFEEFNDRSTAELLKSHTVLVEKSRLGALDDDEVFLADLPGLQVEVASENGAWQHLGRIVAAEAPAGQVLWSILTPEGKEVLFPAVPEFIKVLDPAKGLARICPPPGLLDLYL